MGRTSRVCILNKMSVNNLDINNVVNNALKITVVVKTTDVLIILF